MTVRVKVCGITRLTDARAATEAGAGALGFNFWRGSRRYVEPSAAREIISALGGSALAVGVFVDESAEEVSRLVREIGLDAVQLHGDESPAYCRRLAAGGLRVIKALRVGQDFDAGEAARYQGAEAVLLDAFCSAERGGTGRTFDWSTALEVRGRVAQLYLAGGLTPGNVSEAVRRVAPDAVDVCSGVERAPGVKDPALVRAFLKAARGA